MANTEEEREAFSFLATVDKLSARKAPYYYNGHAENEENNAFHVSLTESS